MRLLTAYIVLLLLSEVLIAKEPVDFNPSLLSKQLKRQFEFVEYQMAEISPVGSDLNSGRHHGKYFLIIDSKDTLNHLYAYIGRVMSCRAGICSNPDSENSEFESEYFDYFIIFNSEKVVESVRVYNYQATHGQEVSSPGWLRQFVGYTGKKSLTVGNEIDAISGATISADAITLDLQLRTREIINATNALFEDE